MEEIRRMRKERGWTQQELGRRAGVTQHTISELERGKHSAYPSTLSKLSAAFGVEDLTESQEDRGRRLWRKTIDMERVEAGKFLESLPDSDVSAIRRAGIENEGYWREQIRLEELRGGRAAHQTYMNAAEGIDVTMLCSLTLMDRRGQKFVKVPDDQAEEIMRGLVEESEAAKGKRRRDAS